MKAYTAGEVGRKGEKLAARYLRRQGYRIVGRNVHCGHYELDLIIQSREAMAFVEVKTRVYDGPDDPRTLDEYPAVAIDRAKRNRTVAAAFDYLKTHPTSLYLRFDAVEVYLQKNARGRLLPFRIVHLENAFDARKYGV